MILVSNPKAQYLHYKSEIDAALARVLEKGRYILGDEVRLFEEEFAAYLGATSVIGVGSGTEALHLALKACGVGSGDEVITVAHTAVATVAAIDLCGAVPVFVDIDPVTYTMDPGRVEQAITAKTKAIVPVHLYGLPADLSPILAVAKKHRVRVVEDVAQAHGAMYQGRRAGTWGDIGCFSFYPTKNLGALGDGGAVATSDATLAERVRLLREYGWAERYVSHIPGWNSRLDEIQAAVLRVKLRHLDDDNALRHKWAGVYRKELEDNDLVLPGLRPSSTHVFHLFVIRSISREKLKTYLEKNSIQSLVHYPVPVHLQPAYRLLARAGDALTETTRAAKEILSLPMYPELTPQDLETVVRAIRALDGKMT